MITVALARALRAADLRWTPKTGDRFIIDSNEFADEVFTISEMTIEAHQYAGTTVLGFNGTTEWALDSVNADESLWLPREDQLRTLLGPTFRSLRREAAGDYTVTTTLADYSDADAETAYAAALLAYIRTSLNPDEPTPSP